MTASKTFLFCEEPGCAATMVNNPIHFLKIMVMAPSLMLRSRADFYHFILHKLRHGMTLTMMVGWMCSLAMSRGRVTPCRDHILRSYFLAIRMALLRT